MRALKALLKVLLGVSLGLVIAEVAFSLRDDGAFPHVNIYDADPVLGVRLEPNASMKLRVAENNPITTVQTNSLGYRAPEWGPTVEGEVLTVGDSQVFGLGVEANETFTAKLSELLEVPTLNGGVPTYGPSEYTAVVKEVLKTRKVKTVVYVVNLSNDLFEVDRPNLKRHAVWDGWAVRMEAAPSEVTAFPFRRTLMSRSHLVFAGRQWLASREGPANEGFTTEGTWKDVVQASSDVGSRRSVDDDEDFVKDARRDLIDGLEGLDRDLAAHFESRSGDSKFVEAARAIGPKDGDARDIVVVRRNPGAEMARPPRSTAFQLFMAAAGQTKNEEFLEKLAKSQNDPALKRLIDARRALRARFKAFTPAGEPERLLPIERILVETKALCDEAGARLLVVALPLDVMVSAEEWKKYGTTPIDMEPTKVLVDDVVSRARRLGALALDPTEALRAAEPGAFLYGDLHMTPKGHAALARAIVEALRQPSPLGLPSGRSALPTEDEWRSQSEFPVKGGAEAKCETRRVREWLKVSCLQPYGSYVESIKLLAGGHGDWFVYSQGSSRHLVMPVLEGESLKANFLRQDKAQVLTLEFPKGGPLVMAFEAATPQKPHPYDGDFGDGYPYVVGACPEGEHLAGALHQCRKACPCDAGHCEPWPTGDFCAVP